MTVIVALVKNKFCYEFRLKGDFHTSYGFGETKEEALSDAEYGSFRFDDIAVSRCLGKGNWRLDRDPQDGDLWVTEVKSEVKSSKPV